MYGQNDKYGELTPTFFHINFWRKTFGAEARKPLKVINRNNFPIYALIYLTKRCTILLETYKFEVKIKTVIQNLIFGHVTTKIRKFAPLG